MGGLILYVGLELLLDNVGKSWRQLPKSEFALVCLIIVVVALLGFLKGIGVGILLAIILFVINYSCIEVIKSHLSGRIYHSRVERSAMEHRILSRRGDGLQIFILQGYLFFGTAERLLSNIREFIRRHWKTNSRKLAASFTNSLSVRLHPTWHETAKPCRCCWFRTGVVILLIPAESRRYSRLLIQNRLKKQNPLDRRMDVRKSRV